METELYKIRSVQACFRAAFDLFCSNFKTILRKTWIPAVVLSLVMGFTDLAYCNFLPSQFADEQSLIQMMKAYAALIIIGVVATGISVWLFGKFMGLLNGLTYHDNWPRVLRLTGISIVVIFALAVFILLVSVPIIFLTSSATGHAPDTTVFLSIALVGVLYIASLVVLVPVSYSSMKYMMEPQQKAWSVFGKPYRQGWHHWGFLFLCGFLSIIIFWLIMSVVHMPVGVLFLAKFISQKGMNMGDPTGIPVYFGVFIYVLSAASCFIWTYLMLGMTTIFYYAYGSIEAKIKGTTLTTE